MLVAGQITAWQMAVLGSSKPTALPGRWNIPPDPNLSCAREIFLRDTELPGDTPFIVFAHQVTMPHLQR